MHDTFRDIIYKTPLSHVAAQLLILDDDCQPDDINDTTTPIRQIADIFMAASGDKMPIPRRWHSDYLAFNNFADKNMTTNNNGRTNNNTQASSLLEKCQSGLIFWMPLQYTDMNKQWTARP